MFEFYFVSKVLGIGFSIIEVLLKLLAIVVPLLISVAYFTLAERKLMAGMHRRRGPNVVGFVGLLQPLADGLKLLLKETVLPRSGNLAMFIAAPIVTFMLSLMGYAVMPFDENMVYADINISILYIFAVSSLGVYGILISGWPPGWPPCPVKLARRCRRPGWGLAWLCAAPHWYPDLPLFLKATE